MRSRTAINISKTYATIGGEATKNIANKQAAAIRDATGRLLVDFQLILELSAMFDGRRSPSQDPLSIEKVHVMLVQVVSQQGLTTRKTRLSVA